jgi:hypothetical protein
MIMNSYEAPSILAVPETLQLLNVNGDLVILPITKTLMLATGSEDMDGLESMLEVAANNDSDPHYFSGILLTYKDNNNNGKYEWSEFTLPENHDLYSEFNSLKLHTLSMW